MSNKASEVREQRRKANIVIKELRNHQNELERQKDEAVDCRSGVLTEHFKKAESNFGKTDTVDQALLDAQIFHRLGQYSKKQAAQLQTGLQTYDVKTYVDSLVLLMKRGPIHNDDDDETDDPSLNFEDLGNSVWHCWKTVPSMEFMHGNAPTTQAIPVAERKKAKRAKKGTIAVKPDEVKSHEVEQTETDRQVAEMKRELVRRRSCNYWMFVIDPNSFTRSVENVFHSSFLVKDRIASLDLKSDTEPIIRYIDPEAAPDGTEQDPGSEHVSSGQVILGFDRNIWLEMIEKFKIRKCILPKRQPNDRSDRQLQRLQGYEVEGTAAF